MDGNNKRRGRRNNQRRRFDRAAWRLITKAAMVSTLVGPVLPLILYR